MLIFLICRKAANQVYGGAGVEKNFSEMSREEKLEELLDSIVKMSDQEFKQFDRAVREFRGKAAEDNEGEWQP